MEPTINTTQITPHLGEAVNLSGSASAVSSGTYSMKVARALSGHGDIASNGKAPLTVVFNGEFVAFVTDFAEDSDDLLDVVTLYQYQLTGVVRTVGVVASSSLSKAPGAIDVIGKHMGLQPTIGAWKGTAYTNTDNYATFLYDGYAHDVGLASTVTDGVNLLRTLASARTSQDLWLIDNGPLHVTQAFMNSAADGIDSRTGMQLIEQCIKGIIVVGGFVVTGVANDDVINPNTFDFSNTGVFATTAEYNMFQRPAAANDVFANWPTASRFVQVPIHLGYQLMVATAIDATLPVGCPVRDGFDEWATNHGSWPTTNGRQGWSQPAFDYLDDPDRWFIITGSMSVHATTGVLTFTAAVGGRHEMLCRAADVPTLVTDFDTLLYAHTT